MSLEICTIGFTRSSAEHFFGRLKQAGVQRVIDIRLHNDSQLAGFAKAGDLPYFLRQLCGADYEHDTRLSPDDDLFAAYRKDRLPWDEFTRRYVQLMEQRQIPHVLDRTSFAEKKTALLCSEPTAVSCHRRLLAELLAKEWGATVVHL